MSRVPSILLQPRRWFLIDGPISRSEYAALGWTLAILKYAIELSVIVALTGQFYSPFEFLNPWLTSKADFLDATSGLAAAWFAFTIPFVLIAVSMSIRRAADAGWSPWWGLAILVPIVNYVTMMFLSIAYNADEKAEADALIAEQKLAEQRSHAAFRPPDPAGSIDPAGSLGKIQPGGNDDGIMTPFYLALLFGVLLQVVVGMMSVWVFNEYGLILFFTTPFFAGAVSGAVFNTDRRRGAGLLFLLIVVMNLASYIAMLCVGLDGAICLFMAFPLLGPLSFFGGLAGRAIATMNLRDGRERRGMITSMLLLPIALVLEPLDDRRDLHRVDTTVIVDAGTTQVWQQVIAFPEITATPAWFFRAGIAAPIRARIEGVGVGACRYCEFTTGAFVEPITVWKKPESDAEAGTLAFDVRSQPPPMTEWTPFSALHPPHLEDGFVSRKGQFVLTPLPGGRTQLTGTTWYDIDVRPRLYWKIWADPTIHAIHRRVLEHIRTQCETDQASSASTDDS